MVLLAIRRTQAWRIVVAGKMDELQPLPNLSSDCELAIMELKKKLESISERLPLKKTGWASGRNTH